MSRAVFPGFRRIGHRILAVVAVVFGIAAASAGHFYAAREAETISELSERDTQRLLESVARSIESIMLPGQGALAQSYAERLKRVPDVVDFRILRTDGNEAFLDNATIREVNARLGAQAFQPRPREEVSRVVQPGSEQLSRALDPATRDLVSYETRAEDDSRILNFIYAVPAQAGCTGCHDAGKRHLGAIKLSVSMAQIDQRIAATQREIWIATGAALAAVLLLIGTLLNTAIVRPIQAVTRAMQRVAAGDLEQTVPVPSRDEVGQMAESFNVMADRLHRLYAGLREEQNKLTTVIQSTGEGVVVSNGAGEIVLVNDVVVRLLGKRRERIIEEGFLKLLDDSKIMSDLLVRQTEAPVPYKVGYKGRTLRVTAATIYSKNGERIGSAALLRDITPTGTAQPVASARRPGACG